MCFASLTDRNQIASIEGGAFKNLYALFLNGNNLRKILKNFSDVNLEKLHLRGNDFNCSCGFINVMRRFKKTKIKSSCNFKGMNFDVVVIPCLLTHENWFHHGLASYEPIPNPIISTKNTVCKIYFKVNREEDKCQSVLLFSEKIVKITKENLQILSVMIAQDTFIKIDIKQLGSVISWLFPLASSDGVWHALEIEYNLTKMKVTIMIDGRRIPNTNNSIANPTAEKFTPIEFPFDSFTPPNCAEEDDIKFVKRYLLHIALGASILGIICLVLYISFRYVLKSN